MSSRRACRRSENINRVTALPPPERPSPNLPHPRRDPPKKVEAIKRRDPYERHRAPPSFDASLAPQRANNPPKQRPLHPARPSTSPKDLLRQGLAPPRSTPHTSRGTRPATSPTSPGAGTAEGEPPGRLPAPSAPSAEGPAPGEKGEGERGGRGREGTQRRPKGTGSTHPGPVLTRRERGAPLRRPRNRDTPGGLTQSAAMM